MEAATTTCPNRTASGKPLVVVAPLRYRARMTKPPTVRWSTELSAFGNNTGIVVPPELIAQLGQGQRPAVAVTVNGHQFRTTVGVMGGRHLVPINAAIRKATGLAAGAAIDVTLTADATPRSVDLPADFAAALQQGGVRGFFDQLSNSLQRYHVDNVNGAKSDDTRRRRIDKSVALFLEGKQR
jgi:hypothetical protein